MVWIFLKDGCFDSTKAICISSCESSLNRHAIIIYLGGAEEVTYFYDSIEERDQEMAKIKGALLEERNNSW